MSLPTAVLEGKKIPRIIVSIVPAVSSDDEAILSLMRKAYESGVWFFDLPTRRHHHCFNDLKGLTEDEALSGLPHIGAEEGVSLSGMPLHRFETRIVGTILKNLFSSDLVKKLKETGFWKSPYFFGGRTSSEVLTRKEIDRISFDSQRFDRTLSHLQPETCPFVMIGERYGEWLLALGRIDLVKRMVSKLREKAFVPILSGRWPTFFLPKSKTLDAAAYAVPINKKWSFFDLDHACDLIKRFDRPVVSLHPLDDPELRMNPAEAFSFLFKELKIYLAVAEVSSEAELEKTLEAAEEVPSLMPRRKT